MIERLTGCVDGYTVNNATRSNRYDVNAASPTVRVALLDEDEATVIGHTYIENTRERPDVILVNGIPYMALDTTKKPAQYVACMYLRAQPSKIEGTDQ